MEPITLIYALNEFKVTYCKILQLIIDTIFVVINILVARQSYLCENSTTWIYMVAR